jgi:hypothetical protein
VRDTVHTRDGKEGLTVLILWDGETFHVDRVADVVCAKGDDAACVGEFLRGPGCAVGHCLGFIAELEEAELGFWFGDDDFRVGALEGCWLGWGRGRRGTHCEHWSGCVGGGVVGCIEELFLRVGPGCEWEVGVVR